MGLGDIDVCDVGSLLLGLVGLGDVCVMGVCGDVKVGSIGFGDVMFK